jgi:hypothetical protein
MVYLYLDPSLRGINAPVTAGRDVRRIVAEEPAFATCRFRRHGLRPIVADCMLLAKIEMTTDHDDQLAQSLSLHECMDGSLIVELMIERPGTDRAFADAMTCDSPEEVLAWLSDFDMAAILPCELPLGASANVAELQRAAGHLNSSLEAGRTQMQQLLSHYFPSDGRQAA